MIRATFLSWAFCLSTLGVAAAAPQLDDVSLRGLQIGQTTRLTLRGKELGPDPVVKLDFPTEAVRILDGSEAQKLELEIVLPDDVTPRQGSLRVVTPQGVSNRLIVSIDSLPQMPFQEELESLPVALSGSLTGSQLLSTSFRGKQGERVVVEVEAQRLESGLRPLVSLVDERELQLGYSSREIPLKGDARLVVTLPRDGTYTIKLHDAQFQGPAPGHFRLKVGAFTFADLAYPAAVGPGQEQTNIQLLAAGSADDGQAASVPRAQFEELATAISRHTFVPTEAFGPGQPFSGPPPTIMLSDLPEHLEPSEAPAADASPIGSPPLAINGILREAKEADLYTLNVTPGTKYRAEVVAQRFHSPVDAVLEIRTPDGAALATADDQGQSLDPAVTFDVPQGTDQVQLLVRDISAAGGPLHLYRVAVTPAGHADFHLHIPQPQVNIPAGGSAVLEVVVNRRGFGAPISLEFPALPSGVEVSGAEIPRGAGRALVTLTASESAQGVAIGSVLGKAAAGERTIVREAAVGPAAASFYVAPDRTDLALAVAHDPPLRLDFSQTIAADALPLGRSIQLPVRVTRGRMQQGPVRLSLVTSQVTPLKDGQPDPAKAFLLEGTPVISADQTESTVVLKVPAELRDIAWDVAIRGELLSEDQQTVLATATTPSTRLSLGSPLLVTLAGPRIVRLSGTVSRAGGFDQPVQVRLVGLPEGATAPEVTLPPNQSEFTVEITLPANITADQLGNIRLVAAAQRGQQEVTSNEISLSLDVTTK